jgi:hypothetical protein
MGWAALLGVLRRPAGRGAGSTRQGPLIRGARGVELKVHRPHPIRRIGNRDPGHGADARTFATLARRHPQALLAPQSLKAFVVDIPAVGAGGMVGAAKPPAGMLFGPQAQPRVRVRALWRSDSGRPATTSMRWLPPRRLPGSWPARRIRPAPRRAARARSSTPSVSRLWQVSAPRWSPYCLLSGVAFGVSASCRILRRRMSIGSAAPPAHVGSGYISGSLISRELAPVSPAVAQTHSSGT